MNLTAARRVVRDDPVLQISETGQDDDGGLRPLSYWVQREVPVWPEREPSPPAPKRNLVVWAVLLVVALLPWYIGVGEILRRVLALGG